MPPVIEQQISVQTMAGAKGRQPKNTSEVGAPTFNQSPGTVIPILDTQEVQTFLREFNVELTHVFRERQRSENHIPEYLKLKQGFQTIYCHTQTHT